MASREWMEDPVMARIKQAAMKKGNNGLREMTQEFRKMDKNADSFLSPDELRKGLSGWGVKLSDFEVRYLVTSFDEDGDGKLSLDEFLKGIRGGLNPRRRKIVDRAFNALDTDLSGFIDINELKARYDVTNHPAVLKGEKTAEECYRDFIRNFEDGNSIDQKISKEEFEAFYSGVGKNIDSDDYFEMMIVETFSLDDPHQPLYAPREPRQYNVYGEPTSPAHPISCQELYSESLAVNDRNYNTSHMLGGRSANPTETNKKLPHTWETTSRADYGFYSREERAYAEPPKLTASQVTTTTFTPTGDPILDKVRSKIIKRAGKRGFRGLTRILKIMDDNGNRQLDKPELKSGFETYGLALSSRELDVIFAYFDEDGSGQISVTEFVRGVRGPMTNPRRMEIVKMAYSKLDKTGDGVVNFEDMAKAYDVTKHPDVLSKEKTPQEVYQEFMEDWDKNADGTITLEEFIDYYGDLSAGIDNDNYFELMIRNAWHISGGAGVCANTSCRRVLVIFMSGEQKVIEIKDDLGIRADDTQRMLAALKKQGVKDIKRIELAH
eukprot:TRINITY_DN8132_c0_g1_i1.p1 TRINITY_DN8132_c0_g1~~TRINITY_DN8132_c0_g1_i1.p1  ORF type:complete len:551 (+),score=104.17 TRINITY_DN8132_c0_g1_i1:136-1788(+)